MDNFDSDQKTATLDSNPSISPRKMDNKISRENDWTAYDERLRTLESEFSGRYERSCFDYHHPLRIQRGVPKRLRKVYSVSIAYTEWGKPESPLIVCIGGVANCAHRFHFLASGLDDDYRIVCMDWVGRGYSGWLADITEYNLETYVEQLKQFLAHLGAEHAIVVGSSLGGTAAIVLAARHPHLISKLILNDTGPFIPAGRRRRRAETLARHYVFHTPLELLSKIGVSQRNDGPVSQKVRLYTTYHQTRWSEEEKGRIYRHDPRALLAYRENAKHNVNVWKEWWKLKTPIMVTHGLVSDALLLPTLRRMRQRPGVTVMHVPNTGHTPVLSDKNQIHFIRDWLCGAETISSEFSVLNSSL